MGKAVIIGFANLYAMPYAQKYVYALETAVYFYDFIFWDREEANENADNFHVFQKKIDSSQNVVGKLSSFFEFKRFVLKVLSGNDYDKVIVLYSIPAVLLRRYLKKHYKKNYVFVYTDYTFEKNFIYRFWLSDVVKNSYLTTVTSEGFLKFLPSSDNILISHNIGDNRKHAAPAEKTKSPKIVVSYIGMLRQFAHIKKIVDRFAGDERFVLNFYGNGFCEDELKRYLKNNKIENVFAYGRFVPEDKQKLTEECDIINNSFANDRFQKLAMTNRFYDALFEFKPQIVTQGSHSQKVVEENGLGIAVDPDNKHLCDIIFNWYNNMGFEDFNSKCSKYIESVTVDEETLQKKLSDYLKSQENDRL